uniref:Uncharacterized protein n=1 Tax=Phage sp. ctgh419 TaxID=2828009 RepID=A0A8S5SKT3_9VIRU|nr:MAG TPA: hypothetical protein [Phage sp. ctgh419]
MYSSLFSPLSVLYSFPVPILCCFSYFSSPYTTYFSCAISKFLSSRSR